MLIAADTHVHLYPNHDFAEVIQSARRNLQRLARLYCESSGIEPQAGVLVAFLTEGSGHRWFQRLRGATGEPLDGLSIEEIDEEGAIVIHEEKAAPLLLVAGRQLVTEERLEVLALTVDAELPEGAPIEETVEAVRRAGGVPVLSWAPGKWRFGRGKTVARMIEASSSGDFLLGDTTLRAGREPGLIRRGRQGGLKVIAGSDPLPIGGEERLIGTYGIACEAELDEERLVASLREMLLSPDVPLSVLGERSGWGEAVSRLARHRLAARSSPAPAV